jgi:hypothetical protein
MVSIVFVAAQTRVLPGYIGFMLVNQEDTTFSRQWTVSSCGLRGCLNKLGEELLL